MKKEFNTIVAGITKNNDSGISRQKILRDYVKDNHEVDRFNKDDFHYCSNKEIKENRLGLIYQYELHEFDTIKLIPEPNNPYDRNAIKVMHDEMGHIGYIPKDDNVALIMFMKDFDNKVKVYMKLEGGKFKVYDQIREKVITRTDNYYLKLSVVPAYADFDFSKSRYSDNYDNQNIRFGNFTYIEEGDVIDSEFIDKAKKVNDELTFYSRIIGDNYIDLVGSKREDDENNKSGEYRLDSSNDYEGLVTNEINTTEETVENGISDINSFDNTNNKKEDSEKKDLPEKKDILEEKIIKDIEKEIKSKNNYLRYCIYTIIILLMYAVMLIKDVTFFAIINIILAILNYQTYKYIKNN